jgi:hypothetical protein
MSQITGHISQIIGPVVDVHFDTKGMDAEKVLPKIHDALLVKRPDADDGKGESVVLDVNLGGLGPYLKLYNSGIKNVLLVDSLVKEFGEDGFVTKYLDGFGG